MLQVGGKRHVFRDVSTEAQGFGRHFGSWTAIGHGPAEPWPKGECYYSVGEAQQIQIIDARLDNTFVAVVVVVDDEDEDEDEDGEASNAFSPIHSHENSSEVVNWMYWSALAHSQKDSFWDLSPWEAQVPGQYEIGIVIMQ